jgi:TonB family protein
VMEQKKEILTFGLLPEHKKRGPAFFVSAVLNVFIVVLFVVVSLAHIQQAKKNHVEAIALTFQTPPPKPPPPPKIPPVKVVAPPQKQIAKLEPPKIKPPVEVEPPKPVVANVPTPMPIVPAAPPKAVAPPRQAKVGVFASPRPTVVANNNSTPSPHVGGFGDPNGAKANPNARDSKLQAPMLGTFGGAPGTTDVGAGAARKGAVGGTNFGSGVANGVPGGHDRGTVASAGFSNGVIGGTGKPGGTGVVKAGGFGTAVATGGAPPTQQQPKNDLQPVTVTYSAKPAYTAEARAAHVEGEVILRVRFTANGQVEVLGVVQPLGHGLDESAENAVRQYRFKPATQNGQAIDQTTTVHVRFQLA